MIVGYHLLPFFAATLFTFYTGLVSIQAQNNTGLDSIKVTGTLKWKDSTIKAFPKKVKISSRFNPLFVASADVDSLGSYSATLPVGSYMIEPAVKYHYYDAYIRVDEETSKLLVDIQK